MSGADETAVLEPDAKRYRDWDPSPEGQAESNRRLIERQRRFRRAADLAAKALIPFKEVQAVSLFGPVAMPLWKEIPDIDVYRQRGIALWHECAGVDLAVWLNRFNQLSSMRMAIIRALTMNRDSGNLVALSEIAVNLLEHGTDRYVGSLCYFAKCPAGEAACAVAGCGAVGHLRQFRDYRFDHDNLAEGRCVTLFDRATATVTPAADLPGPAETPATDTV